MHFTLGAYVFASPFRRVVIRVIRELNLRFHFLSFRSVRGRLTAVHVLS